MSLSNPTSPDVAIQSPLTTFNEVKTAKANPRTQVDSVYGLLATDYETFTDGVSGSTTAANTLLTCATGTTAGGYGVIRTRRLVRYRAGESLRFAFTAVYNAGVANGLQLAGAFTATEALWVGYNGATFGCGRRIAGACAIYRLTVTVGAGGAETATVTLDGTAFTVALTAGTTAQAAQAIAARVGGYTGWSFAVSNDSTVTFIQRIPAATPGAFTLTSTGTAAGTFAQLQAGVANDINTAFVPQTSWNIDKLDGSGPSGMVLDPTKLNIYEIDVGFLGSGTISFYTMSPQGKIIPFHTIRYPNSATIPHMKDPSLRLGWVAASLGSTTNLITSGASACGMVQGEIIPLRDPVSISTQFTATTTENAWLLLRNRVEYTSRVNHRELLPLGVALTNEMANRIIRARVVINPTLSGTVDWQYIDQANSSTEYATPTGITVTGGRAVAARAAATQAEVTFQDADLRLEPGDIMAICVRTASSTATVDVSVNALEE